MGNGKLNADSHLVLLMINMKQILKARMEISKHFIKHYASLSSQKMWDKNCLPEICTLYVGYVKLDAFLDKKISFLQMAGDGTGKKLTKGDLDFITEQTAILHRIEDFLATRNLCLYYI
jgi:hypothetical protein